MPKRKHEKALSLFNTRLFKTIPSLRVKFVKSRLAAVKERKLIPFLIGGIKDKPHRILNCSTSGLHKTRKCNIHVIYYRNIEYYYLLQ